ncbi:MAG: hypothetical protein Q8O33_12895 [Pseudomonadota bacterium]|nr:hypothetical protein [Pseudomonadota bacterium]
MKLALDRLPQTVRRIAEVVGMDAALALVLHYGGKTVWPAKHGAQRAHLAEIMGEAEAEKFTTTWREPVPIPLCQRAARAVAQDALRAEFDRLTRVEKHSARAAVAQLANRPPLHHTARHIWRLLGQAEVGGAVQEAGQGELF